MELAAAERWARHFSSNGYLVTAEMLGVLLPECERLRAVEKAAADYVRSCLCNGGTDVPELNADITAKFEALLGAVRTGNFRG